MYLAALAHALCALGHRLVETSHSVLFAPAYPLVQELLAAKRDLDLPRRLRKLDNFDFLLLDDLGYLPQGTEDQRSAARPEARYFQQPARQQRARPFPSIAWTSLAPGTVPKTISAFFQ